MLPATQDIRSIYFQRDACSSLSLHAASHLLIRDKIMSMYAHEYVCKSAEIPG
jgi:hypothetical protein